MPEGKGTDATGAVHHDTRNRIKRGQEVNLARTDPTLKQIMVAIGWDLKLFDQDPPDMDASLFLLDKNEKTRVDEDFVFYNNHKGCEGAVRHTGDSRTGAGDGDDETIMLDLNGIPFDVMKIMFVVSIYDMDLDINHDLTMVRNVYFRFVNTETDHETFRYELDEELTGGTAILVGELERVGANWIFRALGEVVEGGLAALATAYGIVVAQNIRA